MYPQSLLRRKKNNNFLRNNFNFCISKNLFLLHGQVFERISMLDRLSCISIAILFDILNNVISPKKNNFMSFGHNGFTEHRDVMSH